MVAITTVVMATIALALCKQYSLRWSFYSKNAQLYTVLLYALIKYVIVAESKGGCEAAREA